MVPTPVEPPSPPDLSGSLNLNAKPLSHIDYAIHECAIARLQATKGELLRQKHRYTLGLIGSIVAILPSVFFSLFPLQVCYKKITKIKEEIKRLDATIAQQTLAITSQALASVRKTAPEEDLAIGKTGELHESTEQFAKIALPLLHTSVSKKALEQERLKSKKEGSPEQAPVFQGVSGEWTPYSISAQRTPTEKTLFPTVFTSPNDPNSPLPDIFVQEPPHKGNRCRVWPHGRHIVSCGSIHTPKRREELSALVRHLQPNDPIRGFVHQLESFLTPGALASRPLIPSLEYQHIQAERDQIHEMRRTQSNLEFFHTNTRLNVLSRFPLTREERNTESYKAYLTYALQALTPTQRGLIPEELQNLLQEEPFPSPKLLNAIIDTPTYLEEIKESLKKEPTAYRTFSFLSRLLTHKSLSSSERVMIELALDREVGAMSIINCKGGQDRTGHIRSLNSAILALVDSGELDPIARPDEYVEFVSHIEQHVEALNSRSDSLSSSSSYNEVQRSLNQVVRDNKNVQLARHLQNLYFEDIQRIGLPITAVNTGYAGFKYQHQAGKRALLANPHVMPFLPRFVRKGQDGVAILINSGTPRTFTKEGLLYIQCLRGSM